jgi:hypothetical protein
MLYTCVRLEAKRLRFLAQVNKKSCCIAVYDMRFWFRVNLAKLDAYARERIRKQAIGETMGPALKGCRLGWRAEWYLLYPQCFDFYCSFDKCHSVLYAADVVDSDVVGWITSGSSCFDSISLTCCLKSMSW